MQFPQVTVNGTDKDTLRDNYLRAVNAADNLLVALRECAPHARDFGVGGRGDLYVAIEEHLTRVRAVEDVRRDLDMLAFWVIDNGPAP